jgi:hypothetical protein
MIFVEPKSLISLLCAPKDKQRTMEYKITYCSVPYQISDLQFFTYRKKASDLKWQNRKYKIFTYRKKLQM